MTLILISKSQYILKSNMSKTVQDRAIVRPTVEYFFKYLTFAAQLAQLLA